VRANGQRSSDVARDGVTGEGILGDFTLGFGLVAWFIGWGGGGVLTKFRADRICLKKR
jgi:hypothetical protein